MTEERMTYGEEVQGQEGPELTSEAIEEMRRNLFDKRVRAFMADIQAVCQKHGMDLQPVPVIELDGRIGARQNPVDAQRR
jgi:hypothetical protein